MTAGRGAVAALALATLLAACAPGPGGSSAAMPAATTSAAPAAASPTASATASATAAAAPAPCPAEALRTAASGGRVALGIGGLIQSNLYLVREARAREALRCAATLVTDNAFYWSIVEPRRGSFDFARGDEILTWAQANGLAVRGHVLVWHNSLPAWLTGGTFSADELRAILRTHVQTIVARYRGRIGAWDVLNEALDDQGRLRDTLWLRALGPGYVDDVFRWAREADPDAALFYNDYRNEGAGAVPDAQHALVRDLRARGVPVDGVGLQMHLIGGREALWAGGAAAPRAALAANLARLGALGVRVQITEMDVSIVKLPGADRLAEQAAIYRDVARACVAAPACTALITWGLDDAHTWVTGRYAGSETDAPLLLDRAYAPKPAADAVRAVLAAR